MSTLPLTHLEKMDEFSLANSAKGHKTRVQPKGGGVGVGGGFTLSEKHFNSPFPLAA